MDTTPLSFLTPYWSGAEMMRIHLASIRRFHPAAPILVSTRDGAAGEMAAYDREFGVRHWLDNCGYTNAYLRLLERCETRYACILDHDTVILGGLDRFVGGLADGRYDLVGIEERIRLPRDVPAEAWPGSNGWLRFAPGCTAANFVIVDWQAFKSRWGLRGIFGTPPAGAQHFDFDYGLGQRLARHHYLLPYHVKKYGLGNLLMDGDTPVVWHQWYGSYRTRSMGAANVYAIAEAAERAFIADYPRLNVDEREPAWGPERDVNAEQRALVAARAAAGGFDGPLERTRRWISQQLRVWATRVAVRRGGGGAK